MIRQVVIGLLAAIIYLNLSIGAAAMANLHPVFGILWFPVNLLATLLLLAYFIKEPDRGIHLKDNTPKEQGKVDSNL